MRSQLLRSLVYREAGRISRDVEEDATWLTTVERLVVQAIHHRTDVEASITESIVPGELLCISWCTPAEVMNNACAYSSARNRGKTDYIQYTPWLSVTCLIAAAVPGLSHLLEAKYLAKQCRCVFMPDD
jgi:hypothetical protein